MIRRATPSVDLEALDLDDLSRLLQHGDVLFEGNPFVGRLLQTHPALGAVRRIGMFDVNAAEIEGRAGSAYAELARAWHFDHVISNHDGEDSDHWDAFYYPLGNARKTLLASSRC